MELYLIRHADAVALSASGQTDDTQRPLSEAGRAQCAPLAMALQRHEVHLARVLTSPLLRARQTAEGLLASWVPPMPELQTCDELAPGRKRRKLTRFVRGLGADVVALVGHMPDLAIYAAWLIGSKKGQIELAKAGVARIDFDDKFTKGGGTLTWVLTPSWYGCP